MQKLLLKALPYLLLGGAAFGWFKAQQAEAREAGRNEVLMEQRDSVLAVHDSVQAVLRDSVAQLQNHRDALRVYTDTALTTVLAEAPDTVWAERVRVVVDSIKLDCALCRRQVNILTQALASETTEHTATRGLLAVAQRQRRTKRVALSLQIAPIVFDVTRQEWNAGVFVSAGVSINIF